MDYLDGELLSLRELPGVGERTLSRLIELTGRRGESLRCVLEASPEEMGEIYGLPTGAIARLSEQRHRHLARCDWLGAELRRAGARMMVRGCPGFPAALERYLSHPPPLLFALGNQSMLASPCIAVLGSREVAEQTVPAIVAVLQRARSERLSVAIGGMKTTHRLAAIVARALDTRRIVVLDRGLLTVFRAGYSVDPFGCGGKPSRFATESTLVLSPFRPEDHAAPNNGRRRDEIIAGLGDAVFASTARAGGEVERICHQALRDGKPVFVWRGTNRSLAAAGARSVTPETVACSLRPLVENA